MQKTTLNVFFVDEIKFSDSFPNSQFPLENFQWTVFIGIKTQKRVETQLLFTSSKLTIETLEQGLKYVQS